MYYKTYVDGECITVLGFAHDGLAVVISPINTIAEVVHYNPVSLDVPAFKTVTQKQSLFTIFLTLAFTLFGSWLQQQALGCHRSVGVDAKAPLKITTPSTLCTYCICLMYNTFPSGVRHSVLEDLILAARIAFVI